MPPHPRGTLSPLVPLSLRAFKGEGEKRIRGTLMRKAHECAPNSVPGERKRGWGLGDVGWPSSVRGGGGKEERLGFGGCHVASFGAGGVEERRRGWGLSDVVWPSSVRGEGTDSGSGAGMTRGKVDKCEGKS